MWLFAEVERHLATFITCDGLICGYLREAGGRFIYNIIIIIIIITEKPHSSSFVWSAANVFSNAKRRQRPPYSYVEQAPAGSGTAERNRTRMDDCNGKKDSSTLLFRSAASTSARTEVQGQPRNNLWEVVR